ncbi:MAG: ABC transporter [Pseudopedobacter saltans]|uniref:ABC transporter n=1 Tax=Pseudopedobacter saltans TaxID=151895 RepID=A0A2W5F362_9SPHI|nr:MAG: ABC transporter [Pseudopedobacter saltans]
MLSIRNYNKYYGRKLILDIPECTLQHGIYWIQGVNGSGKSTLLKSIAGILSFDGTITYDGLDVKKNMVVFRSVVNFSDAEPLFPEFLSGRELIGMFEEAKKAPNGQAQKMIDDLEMGNYLDSTVSSYSSGMLKKLSLLLAFIGTPRLILLDEPFITIDAATLEIIYSWIREANETKSIDFVLSSHQTLDLELLPSLQKIQIIDKKLIFC